MIPAQIPISPFLYTDLGRAYTDVEEKVVEARLEEHLGRPGALTVEVAATRWCWCLPMSAWDLMTQSPFLPLQATLMFPVV